ncbi:hypothetical protein HYH03_017784 [Edaphochlamys debaryana]|uniref:BTB domain-containing protein n=1 Tax=Edaphochlamys debaryana TaxID=47281 RepID=A0A835XJD0_9CHLO|nr:hypothetical protein HYH03_017784 [Edaphochlamys debaryana]|eukprot:KAG2483336.1 hypothetical protein HYH03_017784 [Edaphochlamys debaryana]
MAKRKRGPDGPLSDSPPDLHILVAGREEPLLAHRRVLSLFSGVVDGLPSNTDGSPTPWDLRGLVLEGESEPVAAAVVECWLDAAYSRVDASRKLPAPATLAEARPLLLFADAVDTTQAVLQALGRALAERPDLALTVAVGELKVDVQLKGRMHYIAEEALEYGLEPSGSRPGSWCTLVAKEAFQPHAEAFPSAVARELESWLHLAGRLNLVPLARLLTSFIKVHIMPNVRSILLPSICSVFSPRVLQFMPRELLLEAYVRDTLVERPAQTSLSASELTLTAASPISSTWFGKPLNSTLKAKVESMADGCSKVIINDSTDIPLHATLGGPARGVCARVVEEVVAKALEDD